MQPSLRRRPFQSPQARRRPCVSAAVRCSGSSAEPQHAATQQPAAPAPRARINAAQMLQASAPLWLLTAAPVIAADADFSQGSASTASYYATLFLFVSTLPGAAWAHACWNCQLWSADVQTQFTSNKHWRLRHQQLLVLAS